MNGPVHTSGADDTRLAGPVWVVAGPTAGGKSGLSRRIAERFDLPILSMDSMKIYRGMDVGTAKPGGAARDRYRLIDLRDPWESFSVGDYLDELRALGPRPSTPTLLSGGTGLYLNVLLEGIFEGPPPDPELRERLEHEAKEQGLDRLHDRLRALDPPSAEAIHATDQRRIIRALEVMAARGEPFSVLKARRTPVLPAGGFKLIGIARPREELYRRINARCLRMFEEGWVEEVERLIATGTDAGRPAWSAQADQSIGYSQIRQAIEAGEDPRARTELIQTRTRHFARHQLIWFRKMPIEWWSPAEEDALLAHLERELERYHATGAFSPVVPDRADTTGL